MTILPLYKTPTRIPLDESCTHDFSPRAQISAPTLQSTPANSRSFQDALQKFTVTTSAASKFYNPSLSCWALFPQSVASICGNLQGFCLRFFQATRDQSDDAVTNCHIANQPCDYEVKSEGVQRSIFLLFWIREHVHWVAL